MIAILFRLAFSSVGVAVALRTQGLRLAGGTLSVGLRSTTASHLVITSTRGEPVFTADRLDVHYDLGSLLLGKPHAFAVASLRLKHPVMSVIRSSDGSWNLPGLASGGAAPPQRQGGPVLPRHLLVNLIVTDGAVTIRQPNLLDQTARTMTIDHITLAANVDSDHTSGYRLAAQIQGSPLTAQGAVDAPRGIAIHRVAISVLPIATLLNAIIDSNAFVTHDGIIHNLVLTAFGQGHAGTASLGDHFSMQADMTQFGASIAGLDQPLTGMHGHVVATDDTLSFSESGGSIANMPFTAAGSIFAFSEPRLQITANGAGDFMSLRKLFSFSKSLPVTGPLQIQATVEGRASSPTVIVNIHPSNLSYDAFPVSLERGTVIYQTGAVDLWPVAFHYGPISFSIAGSIAVGDHTQPMLGMTASAPSAALPYLDGLFGGTTNAFVQLGGEDTALEGRVIIDGRDGNRSLRGLAHLDRRGEGIIGPVVLEQNGRTSMLAGGAFVRPKSAFVGVIATNGARFSEMHAALPGLALPELPPIAATLHGRLAIAGDYHRYFLNGNVHANDIAYAGRYGADALDVVFGGDLRMLRIAQADLYGPFGSFQATGVAGTSGAAVSGVVQSDLGVLGRIFGYNELTGRASMPFTVQADVKHVAVAVSDARFTGATAFGISLQSLSGNAVFGARQLAVRIGAGIAGGTVFAGGDLADGIAVSGSGLHAPGSLQSNAFDVAALVKGMPPHIHANGMVMLAHARAAGLVIDANSMFTADTDHLNLDGGIVQTRGLIARISGTIDHITHGGALHVNGRVLQASVATLAGSLAPQSTKLYPAGSINADLRLRGSFAGPRLEGNVTVPEGSLSGLSFRNAHTQLQASPNLVRLRHGGVTVGTTDVHMGGAYDGQNFRSYLSARHANLADFNDFFDQNDMLAGTGRVRFTAATGLNAVRTMAEVDLRNVRVSTFALGITQARWHSQGRDINGSLSIDGLSGRLAVNGDLELAAQRPAIALLSRSKLNLSGAASDLDLERWLPALGFDAPVTGRLDIAGRASGSLPKLTADLSIQAHGATVGLLPIDEARARLVAHNGRGTVKEARVIVHGAVAEASGTFGFSPVDPIAIALHAQAPDIGDLASSIVRALRGARASSLGINDAGARADQVLAGLQPLNGIASTTVSINGSMEKPRFTGVLDLETAHLHGLLLPRTLASFSLEGKKLNLTDAEVQLTKGTVTVTGALPLVLSPFSIGPADAPLSLDVSADAVDASSFISLLPAKSKVSGILDGAIALEGTPASPQLFGELDVNGASFVSPVESVPIRNASATLRLGGRSANLAASATVGGGVFALNGRASVANLTAIGYDTDYSLHAFANHATVDLAGNGRGTVDADVTVSHANDGIPHVDGSIALSDAQVPFSAFYLPTSGSGATSKSLLAQTVLHVQLIAGKNARVRSGSIDLGASGRATLAGTVAHPTLAGAFASSGGTLTYFNRSFHIASGRVVFDPVDGIDPQLTATATTVVNDPDTNAAYNTSGRVTITLNINGSLDHLNVGLSSDPSYDRQQILGLLLDVPLLGAVHFNQSTGATTSASNGLNLPSSNTNSGQSTVSQEAFNLVNAQFTQNLLAPISTALGGAVGLSDLAVNFDQTGGLDLSARRHIVGNVYAFFRDSIGVPTRQSLGIDFEPNDATAVSVSVFQEQGLSTLGRANTATLFTPHQSLPETSSLAGGGATVSGVSFSLNRRFP